MASYLLNFGAENVGGSVTRNDFVTHQVISDEYRYGTVDGTANIEAFDGVELVAHLDLGYIVSEWTVYDYVAQEYITLPGTSTTGVTFRFVMPATITVVRVSFVYAPTVYCLTTGVASGQGTIQQPGCGWLSYGPDIDESCASNFNVGESVSLKANPFAGWQVASWQSDPVGLFPNDMSGETAVQIVMPAYDVGVTVTFAHPHVELILEVALGNGCIELESPVGYTIPCSGGTLTLPAEEIRVKAIPDAGWAVDYWGLDGVVYDGSDLSVDFPLYGYTGRHIKVYFAEAGCNKNTLTISISGNGSVSPPSGEYCDFLTLSLNPVPSPGYFFKEWVYPIDSSGIALDGILLSVSMSVDRQVTAVFEPVPGYELASSTIFYCPSETIQDNVVSFDYTNNFLNPSVFGMFHFRVNFYSDAAKKKLVYSAFSLVDTKRWFYNDDYFSQIPSGGVDIAIGETMNIVYDPEILSSSSKEDQKVQYIAEGGTYEKPLVCGVQYYVDIEVYNSADTSISLVETISLILSCDDADSYLWSYNKDNNKWLCSGQGKTDLQVTDTSDQSVFSSVSSNIFGMFQVVWQSRRGAENSIYSATWDSSEDLLYSSGQGIYDVLKINNGNNPMVLVDQSSNFFITANTRNSFKIYACPFPVGITGTPLETPTSLFSQFCYPGLTTNLGISYDDIIMRVYKEDIHSSLTINKDKAVPVVNKQLIRLDIEGLSGAYAVRLRNTNDAEWGGWINIGSDLYENAAGTSKSGEDVLYDAYRIDNTRFVVPLRIEKVNGLRRICCQILTLYGITRTFCLDIFANFDIPQYIFKFYAKKIGDGTAVSFDSEFPTYEGQYVLSLKDENGDLAITSSSIIYFVTIFSESVTYGDADIKFNVIQQGVNDIWGSFLRKIDDKNFYGEFTIYQEDRIFNRDGKAFIELVFPDSAQANVCVSDMLDDTYDPYNLMVSDVEISQMKDLTPEEVYEKHKANKVSKVIDIDKFKQYYNQDDGNFRFGDPLYFRDE